MQQAIEDERWVMVENVQNPHLPKYLLAQGFVEYGNNYWFFPKPRLA